MIVAFLGAPYAGKGTYAKMISEKHDIPTVSMGQLLRDLSKENSELAMEIKSYIDKGILIPDEKMLEILENELKKEKYSKNVILDGYPRTLSQAVMEEGKIDLEVVILFTTSMETIIDRGAGRRTCKDCERIYHVKNIPPKKEGICDVCGGKLYQRDDETPKAIKNRLEIFEKNIGPIVKYYERKGILKRINSDPPYEEINKIIKPLEMAIGLR